MKKKLIFLRALSTVLLFVFFVTQTNAQALTVTGTVNDITNQLLTGKMLSMHLQSM